MIKNQRRQFALKIRSGRLLPAVHLHHEGLLDGDSPAVDDHTLSVGKVPLVGVLELHGVDHSLWEETHRQDVSAAARVAKYF